MKAFAFGQWLTGSKKAQKVDSSYEKILLESSWRVSGISLGVERESLGTGQNNGKIVVCECQQNAVEFIDGFRKKKTFWFYAWKILHSWISIEPHAFWGICKEWRISYHCNVQGKMFFIRLLLSSLFLRSFCVTLYTYLGHSFRRND